MASFLMEKAAEVSEFLWQHFVKVTATREFIARARDSLSEEDVSIISSSLRHYHVNLNHLSSNAILGLLQRSRPTGTLLPCSVKGAFLEMHCRHFEEVNRGRTQGRPVASAPTALAPGDAKHTDLGFLNTVYTNNHIQLLS